MLYTGNTYMKSEVSLLSFKKSYREKAEDASGHARVAVYLDSNEY